MANYVKQPYDNKSIASDEVITFTKELATLKDQLHDLYQIYVQAYANTLSAMHCGNGGPLVHGAPDPDDQFGVGALAQAIAMRGATSNWTLMNKRDFADKVRALLTGKS